jgi:prefoldin subunit 5
MSKKWEKMSAVEKTNSLKNEVEDLTKAVERLNDAADDTRSRLQQIKKR